MKQRLRNLFSILADAASEWLASDAPRSSAALSFYTLFSLAPILIVVVAAAGLFWGGQTVRVQVELLAHARSMLGADAASIIETALDAAKSPGKSGLFATVAGVVAFLLGATTVFAQLQQALNEAWNVAAPKDARFSLRDYVLRRVLSFGMILAIGFVLLVSMVLTTVLAAFQGTLPGADGSSSLVLRALNAGIALGITTVLFATIFKVLPDARTAWRDIWLGAGITAALFTVGKEGIGYYLANSSTASSYGAAGSLVLLLLWIYYASMIVLFGAQITQIYARRYGRGIEPLRPARAVAPPSRPADALESVQS